mgnify:CR=1 FL=1|jgi:hypothetical protein
MPNNEEHAWNTFQLYGQWARDLHAWMDEPSNNMGIWHRKKRHTVSPPDWAVVKYGLGMAEKIMLDHIFLDENPVTSLIIEIE